MRIQSQFTKILTRTYGEPMTLEQWKRLCQVTSAQEAVDYARQQGMKDREIRCLNERSQLNAKRKTDVQTYLNDTAQSDLCEDCVT